MRMAGAAAGSALRKAYGFGSMVMGMIGFDQQSGVFAFPGATMGTMGAAAMIYHDDKNAVVARFEIPPKEVELRKIKANTLGDAMLDWLCTTKKLPSPVVKSPGTDSPFK
jgi:acetyl-CoA carboxylase carboxyltransferase component